MKSTQYLQLFVIAIIVLLFSACSDDEDNSGPNCTDPTSEFSFTQNRSIEIISDSIMVNDSLIFFSEYNVTDGQSLLFEIINTSEACEDIPDSGGSSMFGMAIPMDSISTFSYTDLEIIETSAFFSVSGFIEEPDQSIEEGEIFGEKINENTWRISIDIVTKPQDDNGLFGDRPQQITVDTEFSLQ